MSSDVPARYATNAGEKLIPDSRVGRRVEAVVVKPVNPDQPGSSISLTALLYKGSLKEVNDRGIVESFTSEIEVLAANTFYPWAAGLFTRLIETNNSFQAINRPGRSIRRRLFGTLLWVIEADQGDDR